ncbi:MAG TPA: SusD/RagB family nutrient-binding outer membrane lipoprotein [Puia sp.]|nr:SusD/RagB family nutrient-binding outer membrane lipoprotein [Puia sp.]
MLSKNKILMAVLAIFLLQSCTKNIDSINNETKRPVLAPPGALFSNATRNLSDGLANASVNINVWRFTVKHWAMTTYQDEARYNFTTRNIPQAWWTRMYKDVLADMNDASRLVKADANIVPAVKVNQLAILDVMQVYAYGILVNTFGNVPYSEALDFTKTRPKYDDAKTVYADLMKRLNDDISKMSTSSGAGFTSTEDLLCGGSMAKWVKFANSLRLKMAMIIADVDDATAKAAVEASDAAALASAADNVSLTYLGSTPNTNPLYSDIVLGARGDYVASADLMTPLLSMSDPRTAGFFAKNNNGDYTGGIVGDNNTLSITSQPSSKVSAANAPNYFMDYAEIEFFRAEAIERGYNVAGTAETHYNNAITASILAWGGSASDAATYLLRPDVAYTTATGDWHQKIGFQKWIALYNRPYDGWTELRRLDYPKLTPPVSAVSGFPNRFSYPTVEQQVNLDNYTSAAAAVGGDKVETKLFWDKF